MPVTDEMVKAAEKASKRLFFIWSMSPRNVEFSKAIRAALEAAISVAPPSDDYRRGLEDAAKAVRENAQEAAAEITALREKLEMVERERDDALTYATNLAVSLHCKHWRSDARNWEPLGELIGVLTQIDNMTVGLSRADALQARVERLEKALRAWIDATRMVVIDSRVRAEARSALAADGENNDRD